MKRNSRIFLPDNSLRWIKANGIATFEKAGEAMQAKEFVGTVQDITDAVKARGKARPTGQGRTNCSPVSHANFPWPQDRI